MIIQNVYKIAFSKPKYRGHFRPQIFLHTYSDLQLSFSRGPVPKIGTEFLSIMFILWEPKLPLPNNINGTALIQRLIFRFGTQKRVTPSRNFSAVSSHWAKSICVIGSITCALPTTHLGNRLTTTRADPSSTNTSNKFSCCHSFHGGVFKWKL